MPKDNLSLYFMALIPPEPFLGHAGKWKEYFRDQYQSKASLNSPPHITLHMPFKLKPKREVALAEKLQQVAGTFSPFQVALEGFGAFPPRVIFIDVQKSSEIDKLQLTIKRQMKIEFQVFNADYRERPFHPHLTLAFRDLKKDKFQEAWSEFQHKEVRYSWLASHFTLLKHDGHRWQVFRDLSFAQ